MTQSRPLGSLASALPFWLSLGFVPILAAGTLWGGWWLILPVLYSAGLFSLLDWFTGLNKVNPQTDAPLDQLFWYRLITLIWFPVQSVLIYGALWWVTHRGTLTGAEMLVLFYGLGIATGAVGIVYAHELMHQKTASERWLGDLLMAQVLYSHFRSEHLRVHHLWVATPRDAVTARYNEGFWHFFWCVLRDCPRSAWRAEVAMLARARKSRWSAANPFWRYAALQAGFLLLAFVVGGWLGLGLFLWQALIAVLHLELTNYIEHYGLTRRHLGEGRYEHVLPRHSWNAAHRASNWLLINLQRHSDHHYKPDRRFPLLQTYATEEAPQLPLGYPTLLAVAAIPPLWRRLMNPRVRAWRRQFYPDITDWSAYKAGTNPMPRGAG
ncbi:alkane 1-monooxygenase [Pararhodobacter zhoushanensis]|uniref:Alkane 1-monooxygenase n=1 Tax=Pararhodobacter zhoushanensis TaxID=2479545 RepID=A0ABT3GUB2_9RHOB|nr:alkane 1-monooxygenase [Pararhodobacter zhoushanensis]MCW1931128.1 alkane 1-monooxygenase [Pararhodobacter zhoushanensis]